MRYFKHKLKDTVGPFIRAKIRRGLNNWSRTTRINSQFAISRAAYLRLAFISGLIIAAACEQNLMFRRVVRDLFKPRLIFARINGPSVSLIKPRGLLQIDCW